jgi:hypothetical protein
MRKFDQSVSRALAATACLSLGACGILGIDPNNGGPVSAASVLQGVPKIENSPKSPCWQQRQIAAQRSYIDSAVTGATKRYHADCKTEPVPASKQPEPKTS